MENKIMLEQDMKIDDEVLIPTSFTEKTMAKITSSVQSDKVILWEKINAGLHKVSTDGKDSAGSRKWTIYEVELNLKKVHEVTTFHPKLVSIGPLHRKSEHLKPMEQHKWRFLSHFVNSRMNNSEAATADKIIQRLIAAMENVQVQARACYSETFDDLGSNEFVLMLVLDGCFIFQLLLLFEKSGYSCRNADDPMYTWRSTLPHLRHDLLLLENQLPFTVLQEIYSISGVDRERYKLTDLILNFFNPVLYRQKRVLDQCKQHMNISNCHHLLHVFMSSFQTDEVQQPENIISIVVETDYVPVLIPVDTGCAQERVEISYFPEVIVPTDTGCDQEMVEISDFPEVIDQEVLEVSYLSEVIDPNDTGNLQDYFPEFIDPKDTSSFQIHVPEVIELNDSSSFPEVIHGYYPEVFQTRYPNTSFMRRCFLITRRYLMKTRLRIFLPTDTDPNDTDSHQNTSFMSYCLPQAVLNFCTTTTSPVPELDMSIHCVTELREAGVGFQKRDHHGILDVEFKGGKLHIPTLFIDENTVPVLLNFVAYEQRHHSIKPYFTSYLMFLDYLVNSSKDVEYLHYKGIINHGLGSDEEVATLLNKLCKEVVQDLGANNYLSPVFANVNRYFSKRWNRWRAAWTHEYFKNPWAFSSFLAATVLIVLTALQTYYSWYAYFYPSSN